MGTAAAAAAALPFQSTPVMLEKREGGITLVPNLLIPPLIGLICCALWPVLLFFSSFGPFTLFDIPNDNAEYIHADTYYTHTWGFTGSLAVDVTIIPIAEASESVYGASLQCTIDSSHFTV